MLENRITKRVHQKRRLFAAIGTAVIAATTIAVPTPAGAGGGWMVARTDWTTAGTKVHIYAEALWRNFGCGWKDCATVENLYFQAGRLSGPDRSNAARVNATVRFGGVGLDVGVAWPPSGGFRDAGSSCQHGWWDGDAHWVAVDLGTDKVCETSTYGWVSNVDLAASGGLRFGGTWSVRTASRTKSLGGL